MKRILHVGMPKTGSSSIHRSLIYVPPSSGLRYVHDHGLNLSRALATIGMSDPENFPANRRRGLSHEDLIKERKRLRRGIEAALQDETAQAVILSAEMLTGLDAEPIAKLGDWLKTACPDLQVVAYVRDPFGFVDSMFQTAVRNGRGKFDLAAHYPHYTRRFAKLEAAFGAEALHYFPYEPAHFVQGDVVLDFAHRIGVDASAWQPIRANVSLSRDAVSMLYMYRKWGPPEPRGADAVKATGRFMRRLETLRGSKARLAKSVVEPLIASQTDDIAWMEARLGQAFSASLRDDDAQAIRNEDDLLTLSDASFEWLRSQGVNLDGLGTPSQPQVQALSQAMHQLYQQGFATPSPPKPRPLQKTL